MKVIYINTCSYGSTGNFITQLCKYVENANETAYLCVPNGRHNRYNKYSGNHIWIGGRLAEDTHLILSRITGCNGCFSLCATYRFLKKVKQVNPDIIHINNLHNSYINLPLLFGFLKRKKIPVIWTLHDCWSFTGQCPHFTIAKCEKWREGCFSCQQYKQYPKSYIDMTRVMYKKKKTWFIGVEKLRIVTPSKWLADLVGQSFLKEYPIKIINNGIDFSNFKPTASVFREKHGIGEKRIALGVAFGWGFAKGLDVFIELSKRLDNSKYQIVLVGTNAEIDKELPDNIISIHRTSNQQELAEIYSAADVFVNPTREENFPTVNIEALACGTPIITFRTGGSPEILDETCGSVVECDDIDAMEREIIRICEEVPFFSDACITRAARFNKDKMLEEYFNLYKEVLNDRASKKGI